MSKPVIPVAEGADAALGARLRAGDSSALEPLFERHARGIHDFLARMLGERVAAEDLTQATFLRALERRSSLRDPARVRAWLYSIAFHLALNRRRDAPNVVGLDDAADVSGGPEPEDQAMRASAAKLVWTAAGSLDERQLAVLTLSLRQQLEAHEIGEALGVPSAHASVLLHRSREALRDAVRALLVARTRGKCDRLSDLIPVEVDSLTPSLRRTVDRHLRRCPDCQARAAWLTDPSEVLSGIPLLPLPPAFASGLPHPATQHAMRTAASLPRRRMLTPVHRRTLALGGLLTLVLGSGGVILYNHITSPPALASPGQALTPFGSPTGRVGAFASLASAAPSPTPSAAEYWARGQAIVRAANTYLVQVDRLDNGSLPRKKTPQFELFNAVVLPNGEFDGWLSATDLNIGSFNVHRLGGVVSVQHFDTNASVAEQGATEDALHFFDITQQDAQQLGDGWLPLTGSAQRQAAAAEILQDIAPFIDAHTLADSVMRPPAPGPVVVRLPQPGPGVDAVYPNGDFLGIDARSSPPKVQVVTQHLLVSVSQIDSATLPYTKPG